MRKRKPFRSNHSRKHRRTGRQARAGRRTLRSEKIGALPILNHFLQRLRLEELLREHLPPEDKRVKVPAAKALLVLLRNLLISRAPLRHRRMGRRLRPRPARSDPRRVGGPQ